MSSDACSPLQLESRSKVDRSRVSCGGRRANSVIAGAAIATDDDTAGVNDAASTGMAVSLLMA